VIVLTTDFGLADPYVGMMKAVLATRAPGVLQVDLCHGVPPFAVESGAFVLHRAFPWFPEGTVHLAVVDPGVGSSRPAVALSTRGRTLVGPDNGLFAPFADAEDLVVVELAADGITGGHLSSTFHGRDLFAPAAALLATGTPIERLGRLRRDGGSGEGLLERGRPWWYRQEDVLAARVLWIDRFGNCITGLPARELESFGAGELVIGGRVLKGLRRTFSEVEVGEALMYIGSGGTLEIAVREGNAAEEFSIETGTVLRLHPRQPGGDTR